MLSYIPHSLVFLSYNFHVPSIQNSFMALFNLFANLKDHNYFQCMFLAPSVLFFWVDNCLTLFLNEIFFYNAASEEGLFRNYGCILLSLCFAHFQLIMPPTFNIAINAVNAGLAFIGAHF